MYVARSLAYNAVCIADVETGFGRDNSVVLTNVWKESFFFSSSFFSEMI